jgi:hypothetical protein
MSAVYNNNNKPVETGYFDRFVDWFMGIITTISEIFTCMFLPKPKSNPEPLGGRVSPKDPLSPKAGTTMYYQGKQMIVGEDGTLVPLRSRDGQ